jgi:hypothetical protein
MSGLMMKRGGGRRHWPLSLYFSIALANSYERLGIACFTRRLLYSGRRAAQCCETLERLTERQERWHPKHSDSAPSLGHNRSIRQSDGRDRRYRKADRQSKLRPSARHSIQTSASKQALHRMRRSDGCAESHVLATPLSGPASLRQARRFLTGGEKMFTHPTGAGELLMCEAGWDDGKE